MLEGLVGQRIRETPVEVRQLQTDKQTIRLVVPKGNDVIERVRKNSKEVVRDMIAPGFAEKQKAFKGQNSKNKEAVSRIFHQENVQPKVENVSAEQILNQARDASQKREQSRKKIEQAEKEKLVRIEKEGKIKEPRNDKNAAETNLKGGQAGSGSEPQEKDKIRKRNEASKENERETQVRSDAAKQKQHDIQKQRDNVEKQQEAIDSEQKKAQEKDSVKQDQTDSRRDSNLKDNKGQSHKDSQKKSKDKKSKAKTKDKNKDRQPDTNEE